MSRRPAACALVSCKLAAHTRVGRTVGRIDRPPQRGVDHEHTPVSIPVFMNTKFAKSNFHWSTWAGGDSPRAPKQHTPTPIDGAFGHSCRYNVAKKTSPQILPKAAIFLVSCVHEQNSDFAFCTAQDDGGRETVRPGQNALNADWQYKGGAGSQCKVQGAPPSQTQTCGLWPQHGPPPMTYEPRDAERPPRLVMTRAPRAPSRAPRAPPRPRPAALCMRVDESPSSFAAFTGGCTWLMTSRWRARRCSSFSMARCELATPPGFGECAGPCVVVV